MIDRMSEAIVRAMIEALPVETTVIDANDEVIGWNKHATRLFIGPCHPWGSISRNAIPRKASRRSSR